MIVSVISARKLLYMKRSQTVVARPKARPVAGPPSDSWQNNLQSKQAVYSCVGKQVHSGT